MAEDALMRATYFCRSGSFLGLFPLCLSLSRSRMDSMFFSRWAVTLSLTHGLQNDSSPSAILGCA